MKTKLYKILRYLAAKNGAHDLGKVEILDNEIICYVDGGKIKKKDVEVHRYNLVFHNISSEEIYKIYRVDKPIHYIIQNVNFDREVNITTSLVDCHVTFENCTFTSGIELEYADYITFKNNKYKSCIYNNNYSVYKIGEFCISTREDKNEINKIEFINDNIKIENKKTIEIIKKHIGKYLISEEKPMVKMWLYGQEITFMTTNITDAKNIEIDAEKLNLIITNIQAEEIEIKTKKLESLHSKITSEVISIDRDYYLGKIDLKHNGLFINGDEIKGMEKDVNQHETELQKQRLKLINTLKKIESSCEKQTPDEVRKKTLIRVLKK